MAFVVDPLDPWRFPVADAEGIELSKSAKKRYEKFLAVHGKYCLVGGDDFLARFQRFTNPGAGMIFATHQFDDGVDFGIMNRFQRVGPHLFLAGKVLRNGSGASQIANDDSVDDDPTSCPGQASVLRGGQQFSDCGPDISQSQ